MSTIQESTHKCCTSLINHLLKTVTTEWNDRNGRIPQPRFCHCWQDMHACITLYLMKPMVISKPNVRKYCFRI